MPSEATVDDLLHNAQHKHGGAEFAARMGDTGAADRMREDAARMIREAYALDAAYCEQCRREDAEDGGMYAEFWAFARGVMATTTTTEASNG